MASISVKPSISPSNIIDLSSDASDEQIGHIVSTMNGGDSSKVGTYVFIHSDTVVFLDERLTVLPKPIFASQYVVEAVFPGSGTIDIQVTP